MSHSGQSSPGFVFNVTNVRHSFAERFCEFSCCKEIFKVFKIPECLMTLWQTFANLNELTYFSQKCSPLSGIGGLQYVSRLHSVEIKTCILILVKAVKCASPEDSLLFAIQGPPCKNDFEKKPNVNLLYSLQHI